MAASDAAASCTSSASPQRRRHAVSFTTDQTTDKWPSLTSLLCLTTYQVQQLVQSWPRIRSGGHGTGAEVFRKLALKSTPVKETFHKANVVGRFSRPPGYDTYKEHGKMLFDILKIAIKSLNEPSAQELIELCGQHGSKHAPLKDGSSSGFQARMWDDLAEQLVEHITRSEAVRGRRESMRAWTSLIMFVVDKMKDGYDCGLRRPPPTSNTTASAPADEGCSQTSENPNCTKQDVS